MKIVLASRNKHKISELQTLLGKYIEGIEILSLDDAGIYGEIEENGNSFSENALIKAKAAAVSGYIGIGDDSGLEVTALGGAPGIYSARYAGGHGDDAANNELLLKNLVGVSDRSARFVCALACVFPDGRESLCVLGEAKGEIISEYRGAGGFGYDPLFYFPPLEKTFGELTAEEKNKVSHRSDAIKKLAEALRSREIK
ncbi:MAG: RdgB/HAM1 family non-canonical purine NTP pyrophosphatase [Clostridia bacterium]|nr:RdgB/HAM1 family non-canonical purine NTP pyrophosphatase [Clostridia bacterium]